MRALKILLFTLLGVAALVIGAVLTLGPGIVESQQNRVTEHAAFEVSPEAQNLHDRLVVADWHADTMLWNRSLLKRSDRGHVDLPRMQDGNLAVQVFTAVTKSPAGQNYLANSAEARDNITLLAIVQRWPLRTWNSLLERAVYQAERLHGYADGSDGLFRVVTTASELDTALEERAAGADLTIGLLGLEGAHALEGELANLDILEEAGYRIIGLQHFFDNELGGSLHGTGEVGLTDFGRQVVAEIENRGMVMDLAHSSPRVAVEAIQMTDSPVIVSHTGIYSHCRTQRNFADLLMMEVARTGGVVGIGFWSDHVSIGSDWDGAVQVAIDASELAALTQALMDEGFSEQQIAKIMGGNLLRVLRERLGQARPPEA